MKKEVKYKKQDLTDPVLMSFFAERAEQVKFRDKCIAESKSMGQKFREFMKKFNLLP